jgi:hypothetical protein
MANYNIQYKKNSRSSQMNLSDFVLQVKLDHDRTLQALLSRLQHHWRCKIVEMSTLHIRMGTVEVVYIGI